MPKRYARLAAVWYKRLNVTHRLGITLFAGRQNSRFRRVAIVVSPSATNETSDKTNPWLDA
jgi:hypothetical protein